MPISFINIPSHVSGKHPKPFARTRQVHGWIEKLPMANHLAAANQLLLQLRAINNAGYKAKDRYRLQQALQPLAHDLRHELRNHLKNVSIPLSRNQLQIAQTIQQLLEEQAIAYKLIINELALQETLHKNSGWMLQEAVYLAIKLLAHRLVMAYSLYHPEPAGVWHELHQLYRFAEQCGIQLEAIDDTQPDTPLPIHHTIDFAYKRIVLLSLTEPYHLMEDEAEETYQLVAVWAEHCNFHPLGETLPQGEFVLDQAADQAPRFITNDLQWQPQQGLLIDISEAQKEVDKHLQHVLRLNMQELELDHSNLVERRQRDMLLRLADALHARLSRRSKRFAIQGKVQVTLGLNACHYHISQRASFTPQMDELKLRSYSQEKLHTEVPPAPFATAYREALEKDRNHNQQDFFLNPWWQHNISPIGIALACTDNCSPLHARVGEVAAYRHGKGEQARWQIGVIRWLRSQPDDEGDGQLDIGIMNLANGAVPVGVKAIDGPGSGTNYYRGLLLPKQVSLQQGRSLIVPALMYDMNSILAINMKNKIFYARLKSMLLATRDFAQFTFEVLQQPPQVLM